MSCTAANESLLLKKGGALRLSTSLVGAPCRIRSQALQNDLILLEKGTVQTVLARELEQAVFYADLICV
jgi:hypothetical protein